MVQPTPPDEGAPGALDLIPAAERERSFDDPWHAQAFAMTLALHRGGLFSWEEWARTLAEEIQHAQAAGDPDRGDTYYLHWLAALERLVREKGVATQATLLRYRNAWERAVARTPHGHPITLAADDFS